MKQYAGYNNKFYSVFVEADAKFTRGIMRNRLVQWENARLRFRDKGSNPLLFLLLFSMKGGKKNDEQIALQIKDVPET